MQDKRTYWQARPSGGLWPIRWSHAVALAKTRLPQIAGLVPILGYAVLWSDQFHSALLKFGALGGGFLDPIQRVHIVYAGSVVVLAGLVLYWLACPQQVRSFSSPQAYAAAIADGADVVAMEAAATAITARVTFQSPAIPNPLGKLFGLYGNEVLQRGLVPIMSDSKRLELLVTPDREEAAKVVYAAYYELLDRSRPLASVACTLLLVVGLVIFLLPSVEVLVLALQRLPGVLLSISLGPGSAT